MILCKNLRHKFKGKLENLKLLKYAENGPILKDLQVIIPVNSTIRKHKILKYFFADSKLPLLSHSYRVMGS